MIVAAVFSVRDDTKNGCEGDSDKVARYGFSWSIPPKFEHKLCRVKKIGKIATTIVLDTDENLL